MNRNGPFQDRVGSIWDRFRVNIALVKYFKLLQIVASKCLKFVYSFVQFQLSVI